MKRTLLRGVAAVGFSALLTAPAWAQQARPQAPVPAPRVVVDGDLWLQSSTELRRAFLLGMTNMVALETAYAQRHGTPLPAAGDRTARALSDLSLDQITDRITHWYQANPDRRTVPVVGVIWMDIVQADSTRK